MGDGSHLAKRSVARLKGDEKRTISAEETQTPQLAEEEGERKSKERRKMKTWATEAAGHHKMEKKKEKVVRQEQEAADDGQAGLAQAPRPDATTAASTAVVAWQAAACEPQAQNLQSIGQDWNTCSGKQTRSRFRDERTFALLCMLTSISHLCISQETGGIDFEKVNVKFLLHIWYL